MNLELLKSHIQATLIKPENLPKMEVDGSNTGDFYVADVVGNRKFAQNFGGYPRSEIAEINAQTNLAQQAALLNNLVDYSKNSNPNAGLTDAEIMLGHRSKYQQTASEQQSWLEVQLKNRVAKRAAAADAAARNKAAVAAAHRAEIDAAAKRLLKDGKITDET